MASCSLPVALAAGVAASVVAVEPNYHGCTSEIALKLPYCDVSLSVDARVDDLISRLNLSELVATISPQPSLGETCGDHTAGKKSIGLPSYFWLTETNSGVAAACYNRTRGKCATTFIGPLGMGASFNRTSWNLKGGVLATELRAFHNLAWHRNVAGDMVGLTGFGPNINIARDPRFGRISELPSEDPFHSGTYAANMLRGMQEKDIKGHPKMLAYLKHFTAYSRETNRGGDTYNITMYDYWDSYLAQYEIAFSEGSASGVMCSYNAENGRPSCANNYILNEVMRERFKQPHALVTTDCGAVRNMLGPPAHAPTPEHAAAWTINNGTDIEMGSTIWTQHLLNASKLGLVSEETIRTSARRAFRQLFIAGRFDPLNDVGWSKLGIDDINTTHAQQVVREAALQGMVLLKNDETKVLPLRAGKHLAVIGPMGVNQDLMSDYAGGTGEEGCWPNGTNACVMTIAQAIKHENVDGHTSITAGCDVNSKDTSGFADAIAAAQAAETVILVLGNDRSVEHEGQDRPDIVLSGVQEQLAQAILVLGKPTVLVLSNGGPLAIDNIAPRCHAIVEAFNPAHSTLQLAELLFGHSNRWGKLPITIYPRSYSQQQSMTNYNMARSPGRTYKYYTGKPLFPFGWGLSYTTFEIKCTALTHAPPVEVVCTVHNSGNREGDTVIFAYHDAGPNVRAQCLAARHPVPLKSLVGFERVRVTHEGSAEVKFRFDSSAFTVVNREGVRTLYKGERTLRFNDGSGVPDSTISITL